MSHIGPRQATLPPCKRCPADGSSPEKRKGCVFSAQSRRNRLRLFNWRDLDGGASVRGPGQIRKFFGKPATNKTSVVLNFSAGREKAEISRPWVLDTTRNSAVRIGPIYFLFFSVPQCLRGAKVFFCCGPATREGKNKTGASFLPRDPSAPVLSVSATTGRTGRSSASAKPFAARESLLVPSGYEHDALGCLSQQ